MVAEVGRTSVCYNDDKDLISFTKVYDFVNETEFFDYDYTIDTAVGSKSQMLSIAGARNYLEAYNIADNNYFKLRDICCALTDMGYNIEVTWDGAKNAINLITGKPYTRVGGEYENGDAQLHEANISSAAVYVNGKIADLAAYNIDDNNFFKLRDLCRVLNIYIEWDAQQQIIAVDPDRTYIEN